MTAENQSALALERANEVRTGIAQLKHRIRSLPPVEGRELAAVLLEHPAGVVLSMRVGALLMAVDRVGAARAGGWLSRAGVRSADRRVGELSARQVSVLVQCLRASRGSGNAPLRSH